MRKISTLNKSWIHGVAQDFGDGLLFYEEDLHASLYFHLRNENVVVHVDALKSQPALSRMSPDIIICSEGHIDVLVELKYAPWIKLSNYKLAEVCLRDVEKLTQFDEARIEKNGTLDFSLRINPFDGSSCKPNFILDNATKYAFGVIAQASTEEQDEFRQQVRSKSSAIADRFYLMTGWVGESGGFAFEPIKSNVVD